MNTQKRKELIISLIQDDLVNSKLIGGLNNLGIEASAYYLNLTHTIFKLIGFKKRQLTEEVYDAYFSWIGGVHTLDIALKATLFKELAEEIYEKLYELRLNK